MIALEVGAINGVDATLPWDGVKRTFDSWNKDHDLRSAMEHSVVWYFQEIARRVGLAAMRSWVERLDYGDRQIGEEVDLFWLDGPLTISPAEERRAAERWLIEGLRGESAVGIVGPLSRRELRNACRLRNATLGETLVVLQGDGPVYGEAGRVQLITVA